MSTELATQQSDTGSFNPASVVEMDEDAFAALTPEQRRSALHGEDQSAKAERIVENFHKSGDAKGAEKQADDEPVEGETFIDADGKARDVKTGRFVPHEAYTKLQTKHKQTKTELEQSRERAAKTEGRLTELSNLLGLVLKDEEPAQRQEAPRKVDPKEDLVGALEYALEQLGNVNKKLEEGETVSKQREANTRLVTSYEADIKATLAKAPEFKDAYGFLLETVHKELEARGLSDKALRDKAIAKSEREIVEEALEAGRSPCSVLFAMAEARGWKKAAPSNDPLKSAAAEKIEDRRDKMAASASLSAAGGSSGESLTAKDLAEMSEDQLADLKSKLSKAQWRKLMGG
jgi:hypothetical protein